MKLDRTLYLTADQDTAVEEGDPRAAFLLGREGKEIPDDEAERLGVKPAKKAAEPKAAEPATNKQRTAAKNKAK